MEPSNSFGRQGHLRSGPPPFMNAARDSCTPFINGFSVDGKPLISPSSEDKCAKRPKWSAPGATSQKAMDAEAAWALNQAFVSQSSSGLSRNDPSILIRKKVEEFWKLFAKYLRQHETEQHLHAIARTKARRDAATVLKNKYNISSRLGPIPGIEVGDEFQYRDEMNAIGLHCQPINGIDYMNKDGELLATSIVASGLYDNFRGSDDFFIYIGHGGNPRVGRVKPRDQKLEKGNLALTNSMRAKTCVRVILKACIESIGLNACSNRSSLLRYVYDGLYLVENVVKKRGNSGKHEFKFFLRRNAGQPKTCVKQNDLVCVNDPSRKPICHNLRKSSKSKLCTARKVVFCVNDISQGQEKFPIRVVTSVNDDQKSPLFDYLVEIDYTKWNKSPMFHGCDCKDKCLNCENCVCIIKNGGTAPYDSNRKLADVHSTSLIYECSPSCKCSSSCNNRVSQGGIQFQLEIFKTKLKGWGVRTRSFIPSGSFVCEYVGEVYHDKEAEPSLDVNDYVFEIGVGQGFIDATRCGNIGRFINHSCSPNLCVRDVLYDHQDNRFPHKMLFALKHIPAGTELNYDYNCSKARSKRWNKMCYCGSSKCMGKIYV